MSWRHPHRQFPQLRRFGWGHKIWIKSCDRDLPSIWEICCQSCLAFLLLLLKVLYNKYIRKNMAPKFANQTWQSIYSPLELLHFSHWFTFNKGPWVGFGGRDDDLIWLFGTIKSMNIHLRSSNSIWTQIVFGKNIMWYDILVYFSEKIDNHMS